MIREFLKTIRTRYDQIVRFIRMDDERTLGFEYREFMKLRGIATKRSAPYTPSQNGKTERSGGVLVIRARAMRIGANLPANLWPEVFKSVGYLNNRTPRRALAWKTPFEALTGEKPNLTPTAIWRNSRHGCVPEVISNRLIRTRMQPRWLLRRFVP